MFSMAISPRRISTVKQLSIMVEFMESHQPLAMGRVRTKEERYTKNKLWRDLAAVLNREGPPRTAQEWNKFWNEMKHKVKNKAIKVRLAQRECLQSSMAYTGTELSPLEERVLKIICPDVNLLDTRKDSIYSYSEDDTNDNDNPDDTKITDFFEVKIQENESDSDTEVTSENPLNHNTSVSPMLKEVEPLRCVLASPVQRTETRSGNVSKKSRQICRMFKRREILNEFDIFGKHVASQLRLLSPEDSIQAQADIQSILTRLRLESAKNGMSSGNGREAKEHSLEFIETYYDDGDDEMNYEDTNAD